MKNNRALNFYWNVGQRKRRKKDRYSFFLFGERKNSYSDRIKPVWKQIKKKTYQYSCEFSGLCYEIEWPFYANIYIKYYCRNIIFIFIIIYEYLQNHQLTPLFCCTLRGWICVVILIIIVVLSEQNLCSRSRYRIIFRLLFMITK